MLCCFFWGVELKKIYFFIYKETQKLTFRNIRTNEIRPSGSSHLYYLGVLLVKFVSFAQSGCGLLVWLSVC